MCHNPKGVLIMTPDESSSVSNDTVPNNQGDVVIKSQRVFPQSSANQAYINPNGAATSDPLLMLRDGVVDPLIQREGIHQGNLAKIGKKMGHIYSTLPNQAYEFGKE